MDMKGVIPQRSLRTGREGSAIYTRLFALNTTELTILVLKIPKEG